MSKFRSWAFWRRVQYGTGFFTVVGLLTTGVYYLFFHNPASCFDGMQNNMEIGVDCGGGCVRICAFTVAKPEIKWAESFKIIDGQYNAVAYVENTNIEAATPELGYTFNLYDGEDLIASRRGSTILPPNSVYPIFEGRITTANERIPTRTVIELDEPDLWQPATIGRNQFRTLDIELLSMDARPRLNVSIENTELVTSEKVEVVATIFNRAGDPLTASQTFIDSFPSRSTKEVVFTWPNSIAKTVRSCEVPSDIMLVVDRSGSMAADGGNPPEPLESAKQAAKSFVRMVRDTDLVGYLSYATNPSSPIEQTLSANPVLIESSIQKTSMGKDGTQYTNMGAALEAASLELISERHREDARKVIVLLTDGDVTRPLNPKTNAADRDYAALYARTKAGEVKDKDVTIYTIGFGDFFSGVEAVERDVDLIRDLASDPALFYTAPTVADLEKVYEEIANDLCEEGPTHIEVITKTSTHFAPLR
jgi:Mg-chelatase subunit ChlD